MSDGAARPAARASTAGLSALLGELAASHAVAPLLADARAAAARL